MNAYEEIKKHASAQGVTVWQLCKRCGVPFHTVQRWKDVEPKTIKTFNKLLSFENDEPRISR